MPRGRGLSTAAEKQRGTAAALPPRSIQAVHYKYSAWVYYSSIPRHYCGAAAIAAGAHGSGPARRGSSTAAGKRRRAAAALPPRSSHHRGSARLRAGALRLEHRCWEAAKSGGGTAAAQQPSPRKAHGFVPARRGSTFAAEEAAERGGGIAAGQRRATATAAGAHGFVPARRGPSTAAEEQRRAAATLPPRSSHRRGSARLRASAPRLAHRC